ncbi:hypothetical protein Tco_0184035 [Tanacetum coccineum]
MNCRELAVFLGDGMGGVGLSKVKLGSWSGLYGYLCLVPNLKNNNIFIEDSKRSTLDAAMDISSLLDQFGPNLTWQLFRAKSAPYQTEAVTLNRDVPIFQRPSQYLFEVEVRSRLVCRFSGQRLAIAGKKNNSAGSFFNSNLGSSSIKVKDEESGNVYSVGAHNLSPADRMSTSTGIAVSCFMFLLMAKLH